MNIFKTFEIFLREPLSILRERLIQIVSIQSATQGQDFAVSAELMDRKTQITVVNSDKVYSLFQTVLYKQRVREEAMKKAQMDEKVLLTTSKH